MVAAESGLAQQARALLHDGRVLRMSRRGRWRRFRADLSETGARRHADRATDRQAKDRSINRAMNNIDLLIVGAGPSGMAAAIAARRHGLSVAVIDDQPAPGGQIWRGVELTDRRDEILGSAFAA